MKGLLKIALKLLANDRGKFFTLILGVTFAVFLMNQMTSMFAGIMRKSTSNVINILIGIRKVLKIEPFDVFRG